MMEISYWVAIVWGALTLLFATVAIMYSHAYCEIKELFLFASDQHEFQQRMAEKWKTKYCDLYLVMHGKKYNDENS